MAALETHPFLIGAASLALLALAFLLRVRSRWSALWPAHSDFHGIAVGTAKVYDNRSLSLMLEQLREQLNTLQKIDSQKVTDAVGSTQASQTNETSLQVRAGAAKEKSDSTPSDNKPDDKPDNTRPAGDTPADNDSPKLKERALDLLADQVNLSYDIFNLRLMLERAISDRIITDSKGDSQSTLQAVLGFPISIDPPALSASCAAIVEVRLTAKQPISLVAQFPQEETHNTSISSARRVNLSGSAGASGIPVEARYQQNQKGSAVRREPDTVSLLIPSPDEKELMFGWQFRPAPGSHSVAPGTRQMLAVISIREPDCQIEHRPEWVDIHVEVRSYWRAFNASMQTLSAATGWRTLFSDAPTETGWKSQPPARALISHAIEEGLAAKVNDDIQWYRVGDNKAVVIVTGDNFFAGTSVVIGDKVLDRPDGLVIKSEKALQITIPVSALTHEAILNSRYGPSFPLVRSSKTKCPLVVENAEIVPLAAKTFQVKVWVSGRDLEYVKNLPSPVLEINGRFATATIAALLDTSTSRLGGLVILSAAVGAEFISSTTTAGRLTFPFLGKDWSLQFGTYDIRTSLWASCSEDGGVTKIRFSGGFFDSAFPIPWSVLLNRVYLIGDHFTVMGPDLLELEVPTETARKYDCAFLLGPYGSRAVALEHPVSSRSVSAPDDRSQPPASSASAAPVLAPAASRPPRKS